MVTKFFQAFICAALPLIFLGCSGGGEGGEELKVYPVKGVIKLSGSPVAGATVTFSPVDDKVGRVAIGRTNDNGEYQLTTRDANDGAVPGEYRVLVQKSAGGAASAAPGSHEQYVAGGGPQGHGGGKAGAGGSGSLLPAKYAAASTTDLNATVKSEDNEFNFDLTP